MGVRQIQITEQFKHALKQASDGKNLFITGRAGTGKSTLLKIIQQELADSKVISIVAPTGVAALNIEGDTIHKYFAFRTGLDSELSKYRAPKHLASLDILVIDEISMVRADLLDWVDISLRRIKKNKIPFGGVQMILIGDLYQLPPIVTDLEKNMFSQRYASPYFFAANSFKNLEIEFIELDKIFRQKNEDFIRILNDIRDGNISPETIEYLNKKCHREITPDDNENYITLSTTNEHADRVNNENLERLGNEIYVSKGKSTGEFKPDQYKADVNLRFAVGARIMTLTNTDQHVNGSIGKVVKIDKTQTGYEVQVKLQDSQELIKITEHTWTIERPFKDGQKIKYEEIGSFTQLPIRLAWAITVHKSQGKTFEKVIFERGRGTFAKGQLYVALSRCTSLDGLVFSKPITLKDVKVDFEITKFFGLQQVDSSKLSKYKKSYVGYVSTGGNEHSKAVEISVIREISSDQKLIFQTMINPQRDLMEARENGLSDIQVSIAPSISEVNGFIFKILSGSLIVTSDLSELRLVLKSNEKCFEDGHGFDLGKIDTEDFFNQSAYDRSLTIEKLFYENTSVEDRVSASHIENYEIEDGFYFVPRNSEFQRRDFLMNVFSLNFTTQEKLRIFAGSFVSVEKIDREELKKLITTFKLDGKKVKESAKIVLDQLKFAANRNSKITSIEVEVLNNYKELFQVSAPINSVTESIVVEIKKNMRVCFTGSPPNGTENEIYQKSHLRKIASDFGLVEVKSVTKTKCDLVVAFDDSSMSIKTKKAHEFGVPVISSAEFLDKIQGGQF